jgi:hypothetical protein
MSSTGAGYWNHGDDYIVELISDPNIKSIKAILEVAMRKTLDRMLLSNKKVIFILEQPRLSFDPRLCIAQRPLKIFKTDFDSCSISKEEFENVNGEFRNFALGILQSYPNVKVLDAAALFCDKNNCYAKNNMGEVLYLDQSHLSQAGARIVAQEVLKLLNTFND